MTLDSAQAWAFLIAAVAAGIAHCIAAWRCESKRKEYEAATAVALAAPTAPADVLKLLMAINGRLDQLAAVTRPPEAPEAAPGFSINSLLRFWDLYGQLAAAWSAVRGLKPGETAFLPVIKAKVDGRRYQIGEPDLPVRRLN